MALNELDSKNLKDRLLSRKEEYDLLLCEYIGANEGIHLCAYDDRTSYIIVKNGKKIRNPKFYIKDLTEAERMAVPRPTVGIGFNMGRKEASDEWNKAFSCLGKDMPNFDEIKAGNACLKDNAQVMILYNFGVKGRRDDLERLYSKEIEYMEFNERLVIEDLYFNAGSKLVGKKAPSFYNNFPLYIQNKRINNIELAKLYLDICLWEVKHNSNSPTQDPKLIPGIQNRRNSQAIILNTYDAKISKERTATVIKEEIDTIIKKREAKTTSNPVNQGVGNSIVEGLSKV